MSLREVPLGFRLTPNRGHFFWLWLGLALVLTVAAPAGAAPGTGADEKGPIGYGGGTQVECRSEECVCVVESDADRIPAVDGTLRFCLESKRYRVVRFRSGGTIQLKKAIEVSGPKNIDGRPLTPGGRVVVSGAGNMLVLRDTSNVIVSDIEFRMAWEKGHCARPRRPADLSGCGAIILSLGSKNIWIHHNEFSACGNACIAMWTLEKKDGTFLGTDAVTISNNLFRDSYYGVFIGAGNHVPPEALPKFMRVTVNENVFDNVMRRSPKASSRARVHFFNNIVRSWGGTHGGCKGEEWGAGISSTGEAQVLAENNVLVAREPSNSCKNAIEIDDKQPKSGYYRSYGVLRLSNNLFRNGSYGIENRPEEVFDPRRDESSVGRDAALLPPEYVEKNLPALVGPRIPGK